MTPEQVERFLVEAIHRDPFVPFSVEMNDGTAIDVPHARVALDSSGAVFFDADGILVDFNFEKVRAIRVGRPERVA
jgi:hypothetical protein